MYKDSEKEKTVTRKIYKLKQTVLAMVYTIQFQSLSVQIDWNKKALIAQYRKGLKAKMLNALVLVEDLKDIKDLINKVVKINNKIYQKERANKECNK